jgi:hypothetical protein
VLWWARWPVHIDHGALVLGVGMGVWSAIVAVAQDPVQELRDRLPRLAQVDLLILVGALAGLGATWTLAFPGSPQNALMALLPGADNYGHYMMFSTIRVHGAVTTASGLGPDGSGWAYNEYPQGFHALAATISELLHPHVTAGPALVVDYTQSVAAVVVLGVVVLTGTIVSLPWLSRRPLVALPVVVVAWAAFLWEPGQNLLADGFANFWLAAVAVATALLLALEPQRRLALPEAVSVGGLLFLVANAWAPLVLLGAPALIVLLHPFREILGVRAMRVRLLVTASVLLCAALGVLKTLLGLFADVDVTRAVASAGGVHGTSPGPAFLLVLVCLYACTTVPLVVRRQGGGPDEVRLAQRARLLCSVPVTGIVMAAALLVSQIRAVGHSSYYFIKYFMGFELILAGIVPALFGLWLAAVLRHVPRLWPRVLAAIVAATVASQFFGTFPRTPSPLSDTERAGTASMGRPYSADRVARGVLAASELSRVGDGARTDYLAIGPGRAAEAFYPDAWYHGVTVSLTARARGRLDQLRMPVDGLDEAVPTTRRLLDRDPAALVIVAPEYAAPLRARLEDSQLARRVITWDAEPPS